MSSGCVLVVEDTSANRGRLRAIGPLVRAGFPASTREVRSWLREPVTPMRGVWFVRLSHGLTGTRGFPASQRVRRPKSR